MVCSPNGSKETKFGVFEKVGMPNTRGTTTQSFDGPQQQKYNFLIVYPEKTTEKEEKSQPNTTDYFIYDYYKFELYK